MTLTLNAVILFFPHKALWLMMMYHLTKFVCQGINSLKDIVKRVTFRSHEPLLWPRPWRKSPCCDLDLEDSNFFFHTRHSGSWCCITIPSLVTKCSVVQKTSATQTFTSTLNLCCDLDLKCSNSMFLQKTLVYDAVLPGQVWLQLDQQFRR